MITKLHIEHQNIYFIGCTHYCHKAVLNFDTRPFSTIIEHDEALINNWNRVVGKNDLVFHLGDVSFASIKRTNEILERLNGNIYLIMGNHDRLKDVKKMVNIVDYTPKLELMVKDDTSIDNLGKEQMIILNHYPELQWNRKHHNSIMLHSHSHQKLFNNPDYDWYYKQLVMDVGCNGIDYTPISYSEVKSIMLKKINND